MSTSVTGKAWVIGRWLTVHYEDLVADCEQVMREIVAHCELRWDSGCVRFYEYIAPATSATAGQANNPIYRSSVGAWKSYDAEPRPLMRRLEDAGIVVNPGNPQPEDPRFCS
jgi:hypothetical protein